MADVCPFQGLIYNPTRVSLENVTTQPYDKISEEMRERYYALDPHNIVRVILGKPRADDSATSHVYTRAAATLREWRDSGLIQRIPSHAFFAYFQRFTIPGTSRTHVRKGFVGLGRLEDYAKKIVYPHERTLAGPKEDRLQLLRHTRTHFEQIFMLYDDAEQRIDPILERAAAATPDMEVVDEYGVSHSMWIMNSAPVLEEIQLEMKSKKLIIADGHHRYETALAYRDEKRSEGKGMIAGTHDWLPMTFFNMQSPALTVLPTHRAVSRLKDFSSAAFLERASKYFDIEEAPVDAEHFAEALADAGRRRVTIGVATNAGKYHALLGLKSIDLSAAMKNFSEKQRSLDVVVLHQLLLEDCLGITEEAIKQESHITYLRGFEETLMTVAKGNAQIAILLNPVRLDQMRDIVYEGNVMPQKSTDFYPKVLSGLVLYSLDD